MDNAADRSAIVLELSRTELLIVNNALNEVCNGIHIDDAEFSTRLGVTRAEAEALLERVHAFFGGGRLP